MNYYFRLLQIFALQQLVYSTYQNCKYACLDQHQQCALEETQCITYLSSNCKNLVCNSCCIKEDFNHHCGNSDECAAYSNQSLNYVIIFISVIGGIIALILFYLLRRLCVKKRIKQQQKSDLQTPVNTSSAKAEQPQNISNNPDRSTTDTNFDKNNDSLNQNSIYFYNFDKKNRGLSEEL
ncbi:hypothetical protein ABPG72_010619 [Tetrahymena utriculariae]